MKGVTYTVLVGRRSDWRSRPCRCWRGTCNFRRSRARCAAAPGSACSLLFRPSSSASARHPDGSCGPQAVRYYLAMLFSFGCVFWRRIETLDGNLLAIGEFDPVFMGCGGISFLDLQADVAGVLGMILCFVGLKEESRISSLRWWEKLRISSSRCWERPYVKLGLVRSQYDCDHISIVGVLSSINVSFLQLQELKIHCLVDIRHFPTRIRDTHSLSARTRYTALLNVNLRDGIISPSRRFYFWLVYVWSIPNDYAQIKWKIDKCESFESDIWKKVARIIYRAFLMWSSKLYKYFLMPWTDFPINDIFKRWTGEIKFAAS